MSDARVDKKWQAKGLEAYSTEAILGTLQHYGVAVDEALFRREAEGSYPMTLAAEWSARWTGTGQFSQFLPAALGVLWSRWLPDLLVPAAVGVPLLGVVKALTENDDALAEKGFVALEEALPKMPQGARRSAFMREVEPWLDLMQLSMEGLIDELAQKGKVNLAQRLGAVSDQLYPERKDVVQAVLDARTKDVGAARAALTAIAKDSGRPDMVRLAAVDALVPLEGAADAFDTLKQIQERAVAAGSTEVLYALHSTLHLLGPHLSGDALTQAKSLIAQQHSELERLTGRAAH